MASTSHPSPEGKGMEFLETPLNESFETIPLARINP